MMTDSTTPFLHSECQEFPMRFHSYTAWFPEICGTNIRGYAKSNPSPTLRNSNIGQINLSMTPKMKAMIRFSITGKDILRKEHSR